MANPTVVSVTAGQWILAVSNITTCVINIPTGFYLDYSVDYRMHGQPAPTSSNTTGIPIRNMITTITNIAAIDVYVYYSVPGASQGKTLNGSIIVWC